MDTLCPEDNVETPFGTVCCTMAGIPRDNRPVILTYHDIGINRKTLILWLVVNAPGHHEGASIFPA
ncbi:hypothetical protein P4O66_023117, partial [Electrophorus voltai]